jgi:competence protein ComEA
MSAAPLSLGIAAASPMPTPPGPATVPEAPLPLSLSVPVSVVHPVAVWPRSAQAATAALLVLAGGLMTWYVYGARSGAARSTDLEAGAAFRLDLNRADRTQLLQLPGVGEALAGRIETYRQEHGGFRSVEDLTRVHGIGPALVEKLRPLVFVEPPEDEEGEAAAVPEPAPQRPARKASKPVPGRPPAGKKGSGVKFPLDLNRASFEELRQVPGFGPVRAQGIVTVRETRPFARVEDLRRVPHIGPKTLEQVRPYVTVGGQTTGAARRE